MMKKIKVFSTIATLGLIPFMEKISAHLVSKCGVTREVALALAGVISEGGLVAATALFPAIAPVSVTIEGIAAIFGMTAVVGF